MAKIEIGLGTLTNSCFVIMPFSPIYQTEYEKVIRPAVEAVGLACIRADEIYSRPQVTEDIWKFLRSARIVIAELTGKNTNVFYEVGLAHALGKPVIIITRNEDDVPFDLKALRYRYYNINDPLWGENLKKTLIDMFSNLLNQKQYGTVFEGVKTVGKIEYKERRILPSRKVAEKPSYDLTGLWQGTMEVKEIVYSLNLPLIQKDDNLSGIMTVSFTLDDELTLVQEVMTGQIKGETVNLYGVSYSYLQQGKSSKYVLDLLLIPKILSEGNEISGLANDEKGTKGMFSLNREAVQSNTSSNKE